MMKGDVSHLGGKNRHVGMMITWDKDVSPQGKESIEGETYLMTPYNLLL